MPQITSVGNTGLKNTKMCILKQSASCDTSVAQEVKQNATVKEHASIFTPWAHRCRRFLMQVVLYIARADHIP